MLGQILKKLTIHKMVQIGKDIGQTDEVRVFIASLDTKLWIKTQSKPLYIIFVPPEFLYGLDSGNAS